MAKEAIDYLRDENGDLIIVNGDFAKGDATRKHQRSLIINHPGSFTQFPGVGVGIRRLLLNEMSPAEAKLLIIEALELDGQTIDKLKINEDFTIDLEAGYQ